jgi:hypothetical protein
LNHRQINLIGNSVKFIIICTVISCISLAAEYSWSEPAGYQSVKETSLPGQKIYRQGILPHGIPVQAVVQVDIPVDGRMFACESCHQRSGLGSNESFVVVPPTNGVNLYRKKTRWGSWGRRSDHEKLQRLSPLLQGEDLRPAYTDETLAKVLRTGIDPADNILDYMMPRYDLSNRDMGLLIDYLKGLSSELSPGVTEETIHFATIVTEGVSPRDRHAMLSVLQTYINDRNAQTRRQVKRSKGVVYFNWQKDTAYRFLKLHVWDLKGPSDTWTEQLESFYSAEPVFAILGGITEGDWAPMHQFSEKNNIPCIFPLTELPVISSTDWNTLYFSKGYYQEGETAARYLRRNTSVPENYKVIQIARENSKGAVAARGFENTWTRFGYTAIETRYLQKEDMINAEFWTKLTKNNDHKAVFLWVGKEDITALGELKNIAEKPEMLFLSFGLLGEEIYSIPDFTRDFVYITYPYSLPGEKKKDAEIIKTWLRTRNIPASNLNIQSRMYFLGKMLIGSLMHVRSEFYRDFFLEAFDMSVDQTLGITSYPWLSFGPGQRYASKGCYVVQLSGAKRPKLIGKSSWVIH